MAQQFQLKGDTLEGLSWKVLNDYGPHAKIIAAERVLNSGLSGLLGKWHIEVTVHVPDTQTAPVPDLSAATVPHAFSGRAGIAALLADADRTEAALYDAPGPAPELSTEAETFENLLQKLRTEVVIDPAPAVPVLLSSPGDLIVVLGLAGTALDTAQAMAGQPGEWEVRSAGEKVLPDRLHLEGPRSATAARAQAVEAGKAIIVGYGLGTRAGAARHHGPVASLSPDQVWLVVDARHKPGDTADWVNRARARLPVAGLAVIGAADTSTPDTVNSLGIPVGWVDGTPAPRTAL